MSITKITVCFVFDKGLDNLLLKFRDRPPYKNCYGVLVGKLDPDLDYYYDSDTMYTIMGRAALRGIEEESGLTLVEKDIHLLCTQYFPAGSQEPWLKEETELLIYCAQLNGDFPKFKSNFQLANMHNKTLEQLDVRGRLAGDGNIVHFARLALKYYRTKA